MLADRAPSLAKLWKHGRPNRPWLRIAILLLIVPTCCCQYAGLGNWLAPPPEAPHNLTDLAVVAPDERLPAQPAVQAPTPEPTELFSVGSLEFDGQAARWDYWQPVVSTSPRIIPAGLVLSYLCDSARHQCSGVQLI